MCAGRWPVATARRCPASSRSLSGMCHRSSETRDMLVSFATEHMPPGAQLIGPSMQSFTHHTRAAHDH
eukprot:1045185-Prorocentrum_minimum.AAC.1